MSEEKEPCSCCGRLLNAKARRAHRDAFLEQLAESLNSTPAPANPPNPIQDVTMASVQDAPVEEEANEIEDFPPLIPGALLHEDFPLTPPLIPPLAPTQGLRRNPPVTIEDWPDIDDAMSEASDTDDIPLDDPDCDPSFIEEDVPMQLDPGHEPWMTDDEMFRLLQMEYGDLDDEEWMDMCPEPQLRPYEDPETELESRRTCHGKGLGKYAPGLAPRSLGRLC
ncbi:unnamed protein product [Rhizoctonia solani]|uniref:Uncharacterized protein n=1 Tax=Rhizoctonia solani TaxID=456999 RepID=A0A8H3C3U5_9AGAM|nr:unnamed protein product [Rhizoctonia solani]